MSAYGAGLYGSGVYGGAAEPSSTVWGMLPIVLYSTDSVTDSSPSWIVASDAVRRYATSRGRETELSDVDPGRATIVLDDRFREFDPDFNSAIKPLNRWWIREQVDGIVYDVFVGYAVAFQEEWVAGSQEARTVVSCVDEFKRLATAKLPTMDPPRDTYADVVLFDAPSGFWRFNFNPENLFLSRAEMGSLDLAAKGGGSTSYGAAPAIVGEQELAGATAATMQVLQLTGAWASWDPTSRFAAESTGDPDAPSGWYGIPANFVGDASGQSSFTVEMWFKSSETTPGADRTIAQGPLASGNPQWRLVHEDDAQVSFFARNSGGTLYGAAGPIISANMWYHVVGVVDGSATRIYVNGVEGTADNWTGVFGTKDNDDAGTAYVNYWTIGDEAAPGGIRYYDELAIYNSRALDASRILAHYTAGAQRGFIAQDPGARITAALDVANNVAPRSIRAGSRELTARFMVGQPLIDEIRIAESGEAVDAVFFVAKDGTLTFLDDGHRSVNPWNTVQITFDDTDTEWWYQDIGTDYSDSFIANRWHVTREGGTTQSASDSTSITQYGDLPQSVTGLAITSDSDAAAIATAMVAKYKDPMRRVTRIEKLAVTSNVLDNLLQREIGDRIRILRHPPGGGSAKDQTAFIQKIEVEAEPGRPRRFVLSVSPL